MSQVHRHVHPEWRGGTCRVKWWSGEYLPNGRKRYESKGGFTHEPTAIEYGLDKLYEIRHGIHVSNRDGSILMTNWLDDWLESIDLRHLTERAYRSSIETHIRPYFAHKTVKEIDNIACRAFTKHLRKVLKSEGSVGNVLMVFGMVMDDAVPRIITSSPIERSRRRGQHKRKPRERKKDLVPEIVERLAQNAKIVFGQQGYVFMWTMAMTGMRPAELYGLTREYCYPNWPASDPRPNPRTEQERYEEDVERYGKGKALMPAIRVERQVQYEDSELRFFPPKYDSHRTLVAPPFLADMLEELLASHDRQWVFPAMEGGSLGAVNFDYRYWRLIADGAEERNGPRVRKPRPVIPAVPSFKGKRLYLVRHGHKAWLDEDGHSKFATESRMGHEVPGVEGTYSSVTVPMERAIMKTLQERWETLQERLKRMEQPES